MVRAIHADYLRAGVDLLTAATFSPRIARRLRKPDSKRAQRNSAVSRCGSRARQRSRRAAGAGAGLRRAAPRLLPPGRVPEAARSRASTHGTHVIWCAGVDGILVETINTLRDGRRGSSGGPRGGRRIAGHSCAAARLVCSPASRSLSHRPVSAFAPLLVGLNCLEPSAAAACLPVLKSAELLLVYTNAEAKGASDPEAFAAHAQRWWRRSRPASAGAAGPPRPSGCARRASRSRTASRIAVTKIASLEARLGARSARVSDPDPALSRSIR